jgi:PST family polysaccharide transporter
LKPFDASGTFRLAAHGDGEVRRRAVLGVGVTVFSQGVLFAVQMIATVVLARLLTPADFGVVTMVTTFSLLLTNFGLNGFTEAVLQREEMNHALASNLFWINLVAGLLLTVGFAEAGSLLARFYGDPRVARVADSMSVTIAITSTSVLHLALLKRAMRFAVVSANDILARVVSVTLSIVLGWAGWGYWALVAGAVVQPLTTSIGAWSLCRWVPGLPRRAEGTDSMMRFAMNTYGNFAVNYFARNMDNLLLGWRFNAQSLGFYKKAYDLFALSASQLVSPLTVVAVPALSRLKQDSIQYRRHLLGALAAVAFVGMGLGANLTLVGKDVIRLLLGPGWEESGRLFTFFGPGIGIMLLYGTHGWIHLSIGRADRWFRWGIVEFVFTGLLFLLALRWGAGGIALAWTASFWILAVPAFWYAGRPIRLGVGTVIAAVWKYLVASLLAGCASDGIIRGFPSFLAASGLVGAITHIVMISALFGTLYLGAIILLHQGWAPLYQVAGLLRQMLPWGELSRPSPSVAATCGIGTSAALALARSRGRS